ncbi:hypothetical protein WDU94_000846 [Cyamophila willieti]
MGRVANLRNIYCTSAIVISYLGGKMLKKYKPICPSVSSKDFEVIQDASIVDKQDVTPNDDGSQIPNQIKNKQNKSNVREVTEGSDKEEDNQNDEEEEEEKETKKRKAAWVDEDDEITLKDAMNSRAFKKNRSVKRIDKNERYGDYLKKKFNSQFPRPTWADHKLDKSEDGDDLTKQAGGFVQKSKTTSLATNYLSLNRLNDVNKETRGAEGRVVTAVEFHPSIQVALVAGQAGVLSLFQVTGGADNPKLAQVKAEAFPIRVAHFCSDTEVLAGSNKSPDLFVYNMETGDASKTRVRYQDTIKEKKIMSPDLNSIAICGDNGTIRLYSSRSKEFCTQFKMNCYVNDVCFAPNGTTLYSTGGTGEIYEWDVRSPVPVQTFTDDGCIKGSRLAISPDGKLLAAGSSSGVVNIYDLPITSRKPVPNKTLLHLTTGITELKFNHSSEILAFSSLDKNGAIKLYNVKSKNVFLNFPDQRMAEKLCRPNVVDFSPHSGFFAFTNNDRSSFLFRLNHYAKY